MMRRLAFLVSVLVVLLGVAALAARPTATAQDLPDPDLSKYQRAEAQKAGMLTDAAAELLAAGLIPSYPPQPAVIALQHLRIAPGGRIVTPAEDPTLVLLYLERGTLTVRNTVPAVVTRGAALATPGAQAQEAIPAETEFTMRAGDSSVSPPGSGGSCGTTGPRR